MRAGTLILPITLACLGCERAGPGARDVAPKASASYEVDAESGAIRARIGEGESAVHLRSNTSAPAELPPGFTLFPGASVVRSSTVERAGTARNLIVQTSPEPLAEIMLFYREQARSAGIVLALDIMGEDQASLGGVGRGLEFTVSGRRTGETTRFELSIGPTSQLASPARED